jgi:putative Ca2+/H+ antiporter (TMEM165/GDT1 family)
LLGLIIILGGDDMIAFWAALFMVVIAEMGDKTQLLAMAFATKYSVKDVMIGVFVATVLNHALAVLVGTYLGAMIPMVTLKIIAAIAFVFFGLWTFRGDELEGEDCFKCKWGAIATVGIAFFLAEMGDKTQLATLTIAAQYQNPVSILFGTTIGMMIADGIGILVGAWLANKVSNDVIKLVAGIVFIIFGFITYYQAMGLSSFTLITLGLLIAITGIISYILLKKQQRPTEKQGIKA